MRARVNKRDILAELKAIRQFQGKDTAIELRVANGRLSMTAIAFQAKLVTSIDTMAVEDGSFVVDRRKFTDVIKELDGIDFGLSSSSSRLTVEDNTFVASLPSAIEVRTMAIPAPEHTVAVPGPLLKDMLDATEFARPEDDKLSDRLGLLLEGDEKALRMVCTNGHCLAIVEEPLPREFKAQLPRKIVAQIQAVTEDTYKDVTLGIAGNVLVVTASHRQMCTAVPAMHFPDYRRVMPSSIEGSVKLDAKAAAQALRRVVVLMESAEFGVDVEVGQRVRFSTDEGSHDMDALEHNGVPFTVRLNADYLAKAIGACGERVTISFQKFGVPVLISPEDGRRTYLIAPMKPAH